MFLNILNKALTALTDVFGSVSQFFKCRSSCCNNINIYKPNSCCVQGDIINKWAKTSTSDVESPIRRNATEKFFTPKINNMSHNI